MTLEQWAIKHGVSLVALQDLRGMFGHRTSAPPLPLAGDSEAAVQTRVRLDSSRAGWRVWRNNIGAGKLSDGSFVRWGLANDSAQLNASLKSSDLIGVRPVRVTPEHVGSVIGQFVSLEVKEAGWHFTGTEREIAQQRWLELIRSHGGHARFTTGAIE